MATATATPTLELATEPTTRAIAEKCLTAAWDAFDNHRLELGSKLIWDAAEAALRHLARQYDYDISDPDRQIWFAEMLDAQNGNDRYYLNRLMLCQYFQSNAETGVMPGDDPEYAAPIAARFINHLLELIEGTE